MNHDPVRVVGGDDGPRAVQSFEVRRAHAPVSEPREVAVTKRESGVAVGEPDLLGTIAEPEDIGGAITFLVSDLARKITGQAISVCGNVEAL